MKCLAFLQSMYFSCWLLLAVKWIPEAKESEIYNAFWEHCLFFHILFWHCQILVLAGWQGPVSSSSTARWLSHHTLSSDGRVAESPLITQEEQIDRADSYNCSRHEQGTTFWPIHAWWQWEGNVGKFCRVCITHSIECKNNVLGAFSLANL